MARYVTRVSSPHPVEDVFAYLADLRHMVEWDPSVRGVTQIKGRGAGQGAVFDVTVAAIGPDLTLRYRTVEYTAPRHVCVVARSTFFTSEDIITVEAAPGGSVVTYDADLRLRGLLRLGDLGLRPVFRRIADRAAAGLREALDGETAAS